MPTFTTLGPLSAVLTPGGVPITELTKVWDGDPQGDVNDGWLLSPDLRLTPYNLPAEAIAVTLIAKAKASTKTNQPDYHHFGLITLAFKQPGTALPTAHSAVAYASLLSHLPQIGISAKNQDIVQSAVLVGLTDGRFAMQTERSGYNYFDLERSIWLTGYYTAGN